MEAAFILQVTLVQNHLGIVPVVVFLQRDFFVMEEQNRAGVGSLQVVDECPTELVALAPDLQLLSSP